LPGSAFLYLSADRDQFVVREPGQPLSRSRVLCIETSLHDFSRTDEAVQELPTEFISILSWNIYKEQKQGWEEDLLQCSREYRPRKILSNRRSNWGQSKIK
jgi:hypothetical protein